MFEKAVSRASIPIVKGISEHLADFYLAGGTALALQLGHRKSEDFDFFTTRQFNFWRVPLISTISCLTYYNTG